MNTRTKMCVAVVLLVAIATIAFLGLFFTICAEASTGMYSRDAQGNVYISETGWVQIGSDTYYVHKTRSRMYAEGEACRNTYRWRGDKLYYFGKDAKAIRHSTRYIKLNKDRTVKYIYTPGSGHRERYNVAHKRYQIRGHGKWKDTGMQTTIWWMCDGQE